MPIKQAAKKYLRQTKKRTLRNKEVATKINSLLKQARKQIAVKKTEGLVELTKQTTKALAKAAQKGVIKKNTAARLTSRLMKQVNSLNK